MCMWGRNMYNETQIQRMLNFCEKNPDFTEILFQRVKGINVQAIRFCIKANNYETFEMYNDAVLNDFVRSYEEAAVIRTWLGQKRSPQYDRKIYDGCIELMREVRNDLANRSETVEFSTYRIVSTLFPDQYNSNTQYYVKKKMEELGIENKTVKFSSEQEK